MSLERAVARRRSIRAFRDRPLTRRQISQLCWAAQGVTEPTDGLRAAPSAGALYPIELYVVTREGVRRYQPKQHRLRPHLSGDVRPRLQSAALDQAMLGDAPTCMVIAAAVKRLARKYQRRAERYCWMEAGHVAQNVLLQATALELAAVPVAAFDERRVAAALKLPKGQRPLYLIPVGYPAA